jgi:hypothetical protein
MSGTFAACLHNKNQSRSYLNHIVYSTSVLQSRINFQVEVLLTVRYGTLMK